MRKLDEAEKEMMDNLEKDKLEELDVFTVEIGYNKWSTTDKESAFQLWKAISEGFFTLESIGSDYSGPKFYHRKPVEVKLIAEKLQVWKDQESAQRASNAFNAMKERAVNKIKE